MKCKTMSQFVIGNRTITNSDEITLVAHGLYLT